MELREWNAKIRYTCQQNWIYEGWCAENKKKKNEKSEFV